MLNVTVNSIYTKQRRKCIQDYACDSGFLKRARKHALEALSDTITEDSQSRESK